MDEVAVKIEPQPEPAEGETEGATSGHDTGF